MSEAQTKIRQQLQADTEAFLAAGGEIVELPPMMTTEEWAKLQHGLYPEYEKKRKQYNLRRRVHSRVCGGE